MNILIVGMGKVGYSLAASLSEENNNIYVIDNNEELINHVAQNLDVMSIVGNGVSLSTLIEAGIKDSDILIAVTASDEVNMICCLMGKRLGAKYTIARIRELYYHEEIYLLKKELGLDMVINPEEAAAQEIASILQYPSANFVESFGVGKADLIEMKIDEGNILQNRTIMDISTKIYSRILVAAVVRDGDLSVPNGNFFIKKGDTLYLMGSQADITEFHKRCGLHFERIIHNLMIIGGGKISLYLTELLANMNIKAKVIEKDESRGITLARNIKNGIVIKGDGTDEEILVSENLKEMDAFIALTGHDEDNLMSSLLAVEHGVPKIITKISRQNYIRIVKKLNIANVVCPNNITANRILKFVRMIRGTDGSYIESLYKIIESQAEIIEYSIDERFKGINTPLKDMKITAGALVAVILRGKGVIIPNGNSAIEYGDKIILISAKPIRISLNEVFGYGDLEDYEIYTNA